MIFHNIETIFFHIGKTAGYSIETMLDNKYRDAKIADREQMFGFDKEFKVYLQHATAALVQQLVGEKVFEQYYKFAVVRNPYARMVSVYHYALEGHQKQFGSFTNYIEALPEVVNRPGVQKG